MAKYLHSISDLFWYIIMGEGSRGVKRRGELIANQSVLRALYIIVTVASNLWLLCYSREICNRAFRTRVQLLSSVPFVLTGQLCVSSCSSTTSQIHML